MLGECCRPNQSGDKLVSSSFFRFFRRTLTVKEKVVAVCISLAKGGRKKDVGQGVLVDDSGLQGDGLSGDGHRQISLLAMETVAKMLTKGLDVGPDDVVEFFDGDWRYCERGWQICHWHIDPL